MKKKKVVILGGGISGLASAWFLKKRYGDLIQLSVIEKEKATGGWLKSQAKSPFFFENGARSLRIRGLSEQTKQLLEDLHLIDEIIPANPKAAVRFIYEHGRLKQLPSHLWQIPFFSSVRGWFSALAKELLEPRSKVQIEESVYAFFSRRLTADWAERLIDPLVSGIFAGDIKKLSMKNAFPFIYQLEKEHGSLLKGLLLQKKKASSKDFTIDKLASPLFSFKLGMRTLICSLENELKETITLNTQIRELSLKETSIEMKYLCGKTETADYLISALPAYELAEVLKLHHLSIARQLDKIDYASIISVKMGYTKEVLKRKGFGYLIPSKEREKVLGCIWDSCVFPEHNRNPNETRLTVMLGGSRHKEVLLWSEEEIERCALKAVKDQLGISISPDFLAVQTANQAIPQYNVGYEAIIKSILSQISSKTKRLTCVGAAFHGISVSECIENASLIRLTDL